MTPVAKQAFVILGVQFAKNTYLTSALHVADGDVGAVAQQHIDPDALPVAEPVAGTLDLDQARTRRRGGLWYGWGVGE